MYSKPQMDRPIVVCSACGGKGHRGDRCWTVIGFPKWHPQHPGNLNTQPVTKPSPRTKPAFTSSGNKWRQTPHKAMVSTIQQQPMSDPSSLFTPQQLAQLAKMMGNFRESDTDDEIDHHFSGMISCNVTGSPLDTASWIIDSGASTHMTPNLANLIDPVPLLQSTKITLPTGDTANVTHIGSVNLDMGLRLQKVMCVPVFKHNLLSVRQLLADNNCQVSFSTSNCVITDNNTNEVKGIGQAKDGLYYLTTTEDVKCANAVATS